MGEHEDLLVEQLAARLGPGTVCLATWEGDGHPDHEAVGRRRWPRAPYGGGSWCPTPVWAWHWSSPDDPAVPWHRAARVPLDGIELEAKRAAVRCFVSQVTPRRRAALLPAPVVERLTTAQEVVLLPGATDRPPAPTPAPTQRTADVDTELLHPHVRRRRRPVGVPSRWYEQRKYALCLAMLPRARYRRVLEPGCSVGVLTARLAARADEVDASDLVPAAVERARARSRRRSTTPPGCGSGGPTCATRCPRARPTSSCSARSSTTCTRTSSATWSSASLERLSGDGHVLAAHWRPRVPEYHQDGDQVHDALERTPGLRVLASYRDDDVRAVVLARPGAASVATTGGLRADLDP